MGKDYKTNPKRKVKELEFRYYDMEEGTFLFGLLGDSWIREYGKDIEALHFHNYLEIGYCRMGEGTMVFGEEVIPYAPGCITVIPKNFPHTTNSVPGTLSHWEYLFIDTESFLRAIYLHKARTADKLLSSINRNVFFFNAKDHPTIAGNIDEIMEIIRRQDQYYMDEAEGILKSVLIEVARENALIENDYLNLPQIMEGKAAGVVLKVFDYVDEHFKEDVKTGDIAAACYISETHLRRIFNEYVRMGVLEYINLVRVHKACELMRRTDDTIAMIAYNCGFTSLTTFNRNFKQFMHMSPGEWRAQPTNYEQMLLQCFVHFEEGWKA